MVDLGHLMIRHSDEDNSITHNDSITDGVRSYLRIPPPLIFINLFKRTLHDQYYLSYENDISNDEK